MAHIDPASSEGRYQLLLRQHANLAEAVRSKNEQITRLERDASRGSADRTKLEERLLALNRALEALCADIAALAARVGAPAADAAPGPPSAEFPEPVEEDALSRLLLRGQQAEGEEAPTPSTSGRGRRSSSAAPNGEPAGVEAEVQGRSARALEVITRLLERVEGLIEGKGGDPEEAGRALREADALHARLRASAVATRRFRDEIVKLEGRVKELENLSADRQEEVLVLQRKVFKLNKRIDEGMDTNSLAPPRTAAQGAAEPGGSGPGPGAAAGGEAAAAGSAPPGEAAPTPAPPPPAAGVDVLDYRAQVSELQDTIARLEREVAAHRESLLKAQQEHAETLGRYEASWEAEKSQLRQRLGEATVELQAAREEASAASADRRAWDAFRVEAERLIAQIEAPTRAMPAEWAGLERQLQEQALSLQQRSQTELGLVSLNQELVRDLERRKEAAERLAVRSDALQLAVQEAQSMRAAVAARDAEVAGLQERAAEHESLLRDTKARERALQSRVKDLQVMVDVLTTMCGDDSDVVELKATKRRLELRVQELEASGRTGAAAADGPDSHLRRELEAARSQVEQQRVGLEAAQRELSETRDLLSQAQSEVDVYMREMEAITTMYDQAQAKNVAQAAKAGEQEAASNQVVQQKLGLIKQVAKTAEERDALRRSVESLTAQVAGMSKQLDEKAAAVTELQGKLRASEAARVAERSQLETVARGEREAWASEKRELKRKADRAAAEAEEERAKRRRLAEERDSLQQRVERLREGRAGLERTGSTKSAADEELRGLRRLINCSVCHENPKSVMITKCFHLFCQQCIDKNLQNRNRKCPGCGSAFGNNDVKPFFFT